MSSIIQRIRLLHSIVRKDPIFKKSFLDIFIMLLSTISIFLINMHLNFHNKRYYQTDAMIHLLFIIISIGIFVFCLNDLIIMVTFNQDSCKNLNHSFLKGLAKENSLLLNIVLTGIFLSVFTRLKPISLTIISHQEIKANNIFTSIVQQIISSTYNFLPATTLFFFIFLSGDMLISSLNFKIFLDHFSERIENNKKDYEIIEKLKTLTSEEDENPAKESELLIDILSRNGENFNIDDLKNFFDDISSNEIMACLDPNKDGLVTKIELEDFLHSVYQEHQQIKNGLREKDRSLSKLKLWFFGIKITIAIICFLAFLGMGDAIKKYLFFFTSAMMGAGYVFSSSISEIFKSLIFILMDRPYEIGDLIILDGKKYVVNDMYLTSTVFRGDTELVYIPNINIKTKQITNLRKSKCIEECFTLIFDVEEFLLKKRDFIRYLNEMYEANRAIYYQDAKIEQLELLTENKVEVRLKIYFKNQFQSLSEYEIHKNDFTICLYRILKEVNLNLI